MVMDSCVTIMVSANGGIAVNANAVLDNRTIVEWRRCLLCEAFAPGIATCERLGEGCQ
jgi:hypothetical protein